MVEELMPSLDKFLIGAYTKFANGTIFWGFILMLAVTAVYLRTRSFGPAWLVLMIGATILNTALPGGNYQLMVWGAIVLGITYTTYRLLVSRGGRS